MTQLAHSLTAAAALAATLALAAPAAHAAGPNAENHFAGAFVTVTNEWKRPNAKVDGEKINVSESAPSIGIGYNFALGARGTLGLKLTVDTRNGEYGVGETAHGETEVLEKSHYSLALEPGYAVNDHLLVFGIAAYHSAKAELVVDKASVGTARLSGLGYGVGFKYSLPNHLFITGEVQHTTYGSATIGGASVKPAGTVTALGIGYHF